MMALCAIFLSASAQVPTQAKDGGKKASDKKYPPGRAWNITSPLGLKIDSTLDTLLYNYQRGFVQALGSDAWATTGQFTGPAIDMIYFNRPDSRPFLFDNAISYWLPSLAKQKFYNVYIPYTQLSYGMGYGNEVRTDHLRAVFAGNINRAAGIGAWVDYPYTKGSYASQAAKGLGFGFSGYYEGQRYAMQAFYNHYNHLNKENGGITDDLYITDPAQLQGGVGEIEPKSIPVNLNSAHSRLSGSQFYMSHALNVGYWKEVTSENDTVVREEYVPVTRFIYSLDYRDNHHLFINTNGSEGAAFWKNTYFDPAETRDNAYSWSVANTLGVELVEGFRKWARFGLSAYASYEVVKDRYAVQGLDLNGEYGEAQKVLLGGAPLSDTRHRLWVGGRLAKTRGSVIRYSADVRCGLTDDAAGDVVANGFMETRFKLGRDTVRFDLSGRFANQEPAWLYRAYVGNHFIWNNKGFGKTRSMRARAALYIPWTRTRLSAGVENIQNHVYFGPESSPLQYSGHIQVVAASIDQKIKAGIWNWNNTVTWQTSSNKAILPLPILSVYSNMFLNFKAFKRLEVQVGVDCNWYSKYKGLAYQPSTMTFHTQGEGGVDVGNYIFSDVYLTAKLYDVRLFLMCSNLSQGWFERGAFSLPHYPVDPRQLRLGLSIEFAN